MNVVGLCRIMESTMGLPVQLLASLAGFLRLYNCSTVMVEQKMTEPQTQLLFPKLKSDKGKKKRERDKSYQGFRREVHRVAKGRCENRFCQSLETHCLPGLSPHHIHRRGQGGSDDVTNGILLCTQCHHRAEHGYKHPIDGWLTQRQYVISLLEDWLGDDRFRWTAVLKYLESKEPE